MNDYILLGIVWVIGMYLYALFDSVYSKYTYGLDVTLPTEFGFGDYIIMMCWPIILVVYLSIRTYSIIIRFIVKCWEFGSREVRNPFTPVMLNHLDRVSTKIVKRIKKC